MSHTSQKTAPIVHRVLYIPELLDMVFNYLEPFSNAVNARVCKRWSEVALDTLWREVDDMHRLCTLLAPLYVGDDSEYKFARILETADWKRFERYSRRVRRLSYRPELQCKPQLSQSVFDDIARTRTTLSVLPNMHSLEWEGPITLAVMFMHPGVRRFAICLPLILDLTAITPGTDNIEAVPSPDSPILKTFLAEVQDRMPNLHHLDVRMNFALRRIEGEMVKLITGLPRLKKITMPRFCVTTNVMNALSKLDSLSCIEFQYSSEQGSGDPEDIHEFRPTLEEGVLLSLWDLSLTICYEDANRFLSASFAPTNIKMLFLDSHLFESPENIHELLVTISQKCQLLESLALITLVHPTLPPDAQAELSESITFQTLKPLLNCPNLNSFELVHDNPILITQAEVEVLAEAWPNLETLILNNEPVFINCSTLTLEALIPFAKHCPRLRHLGLFINASTLGHEYCSTPTSSVSPSKRARVGYDGPAFKSLKKLSMGVSPISDEKGVALFLSTLCPVDCRVEAGVTWDEKAPVGFHLARAIEVRCGRWMHVEELLPGMVELRLQERERTRELERENEDLKIRNSVLLDRLGMGHHAGDDTCITA
ncbi:hypothetical protein AMATHDRAFT_67573 [Amanita thiersii Skay4041]|uniref:F-box domain-containing protein n=1 Tax=Amanita thiersii Skay4041 TaxID=703135 RepID=A0A2A9NGZ6_9AGAR|nr:hypothetical protein AMATHDRAFT_67573 [Amanita thiersii Skay4041]